MTLNERTKKLLNSLAQTILVATLLYEDHNKLTTLHANTREHILCLKRVRKSRLYVND